MKDWAALSRLNRDTLVVRALEAGARRYRVYRNAKDASLALIVVELPDDDTADELGRDVDAQLDALVGPGEPSTRIWEETTLDAVDRGSSVMGASAAAREEGGAACRHEVGVTESQG